MSRGYAIADINILLIHPCEIIRRGIGVLLQQNGAKHVALFDNCQDVINQYESVPADLVLVHYSECKDPGSVRDIIDRTGARIALLAASDRFHNDRYEDILPRIMEGVTGFLDMNEPVNVFLSELEDVIAGDIVISSRFAASISPRGDSQGRDLSGVLSLREAQILELIANGSTNIEIGKALNISPHTVKGHLTHILTKLNLKNRQQAASYIMKQHMKAVHN